MAFATLVSVFYIVEIVRCVSYLVRRVAPSHA